MSALKSVIKRAGNKLAWIESHQDIETHPKTLDLMTFMGWELDMAVSKLHRFWWWCLRYAEDGDLRKHNDDRLARAVALNGGDEAKRFVEAMVKARWLDREPYFRVHNWWKYAGRLLQIRYKHDPEKWKAVRSLYSVDLDDNPPKNGSKGDTTRPTKPDQPDQPKSKEGARAKFVKPTVAEVEAYAKSIDYHFDAGLFVDHYEANGWRVGKNQMRDWKATVRTWKNRRHEYGNQNSRGVGGTVHAGLAAPKPGERIVD